MEKIKIGGIIQHDHLARISLNAVAGQSFTASELLNGLGLQGINVQFIVHSIDQNGQDHVILCIDRQDLDTALKITIEVQETLSGQSVSYTDNVASVGIFGPDFRIRPGIAGTFLNALKLKGVQIQAVSTSISTCAVIIQDSQVDEAIQAIQATFQLPT